MPVAGVTVGAITGAEAAPLAKLLAAVPASWLAQSLFS
jgi:hypothetical protein